VDVERRTLLQQRVCDGEHGLEGLRVGKRTVGDGVQVGEVDHRPHPRQLRRDREDVLRGAELADAAHHLDPERHHPALAFQPLAQLAELLDDRGQRVLARAAEQEAGVHDDELRVGRDGDAGRVVQHPDRHAVLLVVLDVAEEPGQRGVHGEHDLRVARQLAEPLRPRVVHPEPTLEIDLARAVAALEQQLDGLLGALPRGDAGRPEPDRSHGHEGSRCRPGGSVS